MQRWNPYTLITRFSLFPLSMNISEELRITEILLHCLNLIKHSILSKNVHKRDGIKLPGIVIRYQK